MTYATAGNACRSISTYDSRDEQQMLSRTPEVQFAAEQQRHHFKNSKFESMVMNNEDLAEVDVAGVKEGQSD